MCNIWIKNKYKSFYFFFFLAKITTVLAQTISVASIKRRLCKTLVHISVDADVRGQCVSGERC